MSDTPSKQELEKRLIRIFDAVHLSVEERMAPLRQVEKYKNSGIEAWFKVEVFHALREVDPVHCPNNKGPDLTLRDSLLIELKGATDFSTPWFKKGLKYGVPCLFLGCVKKPHELHRLQECREFHVVRVHPLNNTGWHVGMIVPNGYFS